MTELLLSGLHAASACRSDLLSFLSTLGFQSSYFQTDVIGGSLPMCLFTDMPVLTSLALSGNSLIGSFPAIDQQLPPTLELLDLSHNQLVGSIPRSILAAPLSLLDLSFNRFSGELSTNGTVYVGQTAASQISLQVNMLSGTLPRAWIDIADIQVLEGNMFACDSNTLGVTANIPIHDPLSSSYTCGSSSTNIAMVVVTVIVGFMGCSSMAWVVYRYRSLKPLVQEARVQWRLASNLLGRH
eukprot:gene23382-biopygen8666